MNTVPAFEDVLQLTQEATQRQLRCSHANRDWIDDVQFCRSCLKVVFEEDLP
jgi:hypothetical protein